MIPWKYQFWHFQMFWWKFAKSLVSFSKPQISFSSNFAWLFSVIKDNSSVLFLVKCYIYFAQKGQITVQILETLVLRWKFTKFLSFLKQQINFSSNFASLFSIMRHNSSVLFSWNFICFQQNEPIKVQIWWNFTWAAKSLKFCPLMGSCCKNHIKFSLKKDRRVIPHDVEEWCKV